MTVTLRPFAAFVLLAWSPAFAQTICHDPPAGMSCPGDHDNKPNDESVNHDASRAPHFTRNGARMDAMKTLTLR
jgi:hypothetical protein